MAHLTVDEMIDFVSFDRLDEDALAVAVRVNSHIRSCPECLEKVRAFQAVRDELARLGIRESPREGSGETEYLGADR